MTARRLLSALLPLAVLSTVACAAQTEEPVVQSQEALTLPLILPGGGTGAKGWGFAWINPPYAVATDYAFDSAGGVPTYSGSNGEYVVSFPGLGRAEGNVQISGYGPSSDRCMVEWWRPNATNPSQLDVKVGCTTGTGLPLTHDTPFVVFFDNEKEPGSYATEGGAYLWTSDLSGTVGASYSWNSANGANTVRRTDVGKYTVSLVGQPFANATVHVTTYGANDGRFCRLDSRGYSIGNVSCWDRFEHQADAQFTLLYSKDGAKQHTEGGHALVKADTGEADSTLSFAATSYECTSGTVTAAADPFSPNTTNVTFPDVDGGLNGIALVSPQHISANCKVLSWGSSGTGATVRTICFDALGRPVPARGATVSFTKNRLRAPC